ACVPVARIVFSHAIHIQINAQPRPGGVLIAEDTIAQNGIAGLRERRCVTDRDSIAGVICDDVTCTRLSTPDKIVVPEQAYSRSSAVAYIQCGAHVRADKIALNSISFAVD